MDGFYVYAIVSSFSRRIYVGIARFPEKRLIDHNKGKTRSTRLYIPWRLFYTEYCGEATVAREREKYFKSAAGKRRLRAILSATKE